jgi:hypothetical protein
MVKLFLLSLLASCALAPHSLDRPDWVTAIRNGDEALKVPHGSKVYYRRIAGSPQYSRQVSCELAVRKAEEDLKKEYPLQGQLPFTVEVIFYDPQFHDCAVTISVGQDLASKYAEVKEQHQDYLRRRDQLNAQETVTAEEAAELLQLRSQSAMEFAITGLTREEFEKFAKDKVHLNLAGGDCQRAFRAPAYSVHGTTQVCWQGEHVVGYCTGLDRQCWTRTP